MSFVSALIRLASLKFVILILSSCRFSCFGNLLASQSILSEQDAARGEMMPNALVSLPGESVVLSGLDELWKKPKTVILSWQLSTVDFLSIQSKRMVWS